MLPDHEKCLLHHHGRFIGGAGHDGSWADADILAWDTSDTVHNRDDACGRRVCAQSLLPPTIHHCSFLKIVTLASLAPISISRVHL